MRYTIAARESKSWTTSFEDAVNAAFRASSPGFPVEVLDDEGTRLALVWSDGGVDYTAEARKHRASTQ